MKLLSRFSLAQQVMLIVAAGLVLAQALNFGLSLRERQAFSLENSAAPAISRLIDALEAIEQGSLPDRRGPPRTRVRLSADSPIGAQTSRLESIEALAIARIAQDTQSTVRDVRAAMLPGPRGNQNLVISVQLAAGQWLTARTRGPAPIGEAIVALSVQTMVILAALLLPLLLLVRSVTRPLSALTRDAERWDATAGELAIGKPSAAPTGPRDIRDLVMAVEDMKARIADMLRERNVMLGAIGHDLRTPLAALRIQVELIENEPQKQDMVAEIERLSDDLENILSLARSSANLRREAHDLVQIAFEVAADFRARGTEVDVEARVPLIAVIDATAMRRAISNLVDNAIRYGGSAKIRFATEDRAANVIVEDCGPGIPDADLTGAVEAFVRLEPSRNRTTGGHGLGLAIVAATARNHGGRMYLKNRPGGGLCAVVSVPIASKAT